MLTDDYFYGTKHYNKNLKELCRPIDKYLGTTQVGYVSIDKNGMLFIINSNVGMLEDNIQNHGYKNATIMVSPKNMHSGFAFDNACTDEAYKNNNLYTFITKFGWHNSFIYAEKDKFGGYFAVNLATTKENYAISNRVVNESKIIKKLIRDLHNKVILMFNKDIQENSVDFAALRGDSFHTAKGRVFNEQFEQEQKKCFGFGIR